ncbi:RNA polymerase II transcriptional coactivator KELP [Penicillium verhagenii]|nr:RNA polymerase II transcriptional coactivator KELP [Penicillium verhagenii]
MTSRKRSSDAQNLGDDDSLQAKKAKVSSGDAGIPKEDSNGDKYWEISKMRRVTVSSFRGKPMVSVREFYEKDGQELPGKKGISMPVAQFAALVKILPDIEEALKGQGESLPRPAYSGGGAQSDGEDQDKPNKSSSPSKPNIEATSEEDSEA